MKIPSEIQKDQDGFWRDDAGKAIANPEITFAGEYYLAVHSCGMCCRYYTMNNLRTGGEIKEVSMFNAGEPAPRTRDGREYVTMLFSRPDSNLLVAQFELDPCSPTEGNDCRERYYIFEKGRLKAISRTLQSCSVQN